MTSYLKLSLTALTYLQSTSNLFDNKDAIIQTISSITILLVIIISPVLTSIYLYRNFSKFRNLIFLK